MLGFAGRWMLLFLISILLLACASTDSNDSSEGFVQIDSPLREAVGLPASVAEQLMVQSEYATRFEEFIATCMREKGFEYYPRPQTDKQQILAAGYGMPQTNSQKRTVSEYLTQICLVPHPLQTEIADIQTH
ncbi:MAG: hypothetical protein OXB90_08490 [Acidimicrobiaceae bacterium]|nr:hypothetical protein [Acidimicrobiaceae bacterium]